MRVTLGSFGSLNALEVQGSPSELSTATTVPGEVRVLSLQVLLFKKTCHLHFYTNWCQDGNELQGHLAGVEFTSSRCGFPGLPGGETVQRLTSPVGQVVMKKKY